MVGAEVGSALCGRTCVAVRPSVRPSQSSKPALRQYVLPPASL